jgi:Ras-related protein Rab-32
MEEECQKYAFKILVIGDINTGKTSLIKRYVNNIFSINCRSTIGVDFALKDLDWDENTEVRVQLWDIAGQERFGNLTRVYYKDAIAAFIVFDVTTTNTFDAISTWKSDLDTKVSFLNTVEPIPVILLANKIDLYNPDKPNQSWNTISKDIDDYCNNHGFIAWFKTSAKDDIGISDAVNKLIDSILEKTKNLPLNTNKQEYEEKNKSYASIIDLELDADRSPNKNCC